MKMIAMRTLAAAGALAIAAAFPAVAADYTLSVNTALAVTDPLYKGLESFVAGVATASGGRIEVKLFPNSQLGPDEDVLEQARAGIGHQQRRMGGHDYLAVLRLIHAAQELHEFDLARGRERGFRLIKDEKTLALAAFLEEAQETLAVRV